MIRENYEEQRIIPTQFERVGNLYVEEPYEEGLKQAHVSLWLVHKFLGEASTTDEMEPHWFKKNEIPWNKMHPNDKYFLNKILAGEKSVNVQIKTDGKNVSDVKYM